MALYWNSYFGQWLDDEDNDIPNDMPNDVSNDIDNFEEELDEEGLIHFNENELKWWKDFEDKIKQGKVFRNNFRGDKCSKK